MAIVVKAGPNDNTDSVIRKFQKRVLMEGLIPEIRAREFHKKPSELRQEYLAEKRRKIMRYKRYGG
ncbi:MAG: 30S ribosomal protein S21 [Candidatus Daviesbacteria bacterium]|nr:30S ribosomal protein S21 [Candidatus Daviesbacteria bacterium]